MHANTRLVTLVASRHSLPPTVTCSGISWLIHGQLNQLAGYECKTISPFKGPTVSGIEVKYDALYVKGSWWDKPLLWLITLLPGRLRKRWFFSSDSAKILRCLKVAIFAGRQNADVIISHVYPALFKMVQIFKRKSAKHIFYYHGSLLQQLPDEQLEFFSKHCDGLITINNLTLKPTEIAKKYFTFPVCKILNAVQIEAPDKQSQTSKHNSGFYVDETYFSILYAGSLVPGKGVDVLIQAVTEVQKTYPEVRLFIAGKIPVPDDPNYPFFLQLQAQAKRIAGSITFLGWVSHADLIHRYKEFNLSVLLSKGQEGNSLFLMESIVQGTPVLASRLGGIPEVVDEGLTGLLVDDPGNVQEVVMRLNKLIEDDQYYHQMRENCLKIGAEKFSYTRAAQELNQFIATVITAS